MTWLRRQQPCLTPGCGSAELMLVIAKPVSVGFYLLSR